MIDLGSKPNTADTETTQILDDVQSKVAFYLPEYTNSDDIDKHIAKLQTFKKNLHVVEERVFAHEIRGLLAIPRTSD
jgi:hypothetical protein